MPRNKGKGKRTSADSADDELQPEPPSSSQPPAHKKTCSDTVTQPPVRASTHKKGPARPQAATPACAAQSSESGESFPLLLPSPPDTPSNVDGDSVVPAVSLDQLLMPESQRSTVAHDVWHFFEKGDRRLNRKSVCRVCACIPSTLCFTLLLLICFNYSKNIAADFEKYKKSTISMHHQQGSVIYNTILSVITPTNIRRSVKKRNRQ